MTAEEKAIHNAKLGAVLRRFLEGWGMSVEENAMAKFAEMATCGDEISATTLVVPRDADHYRAGMLRSARANFLAEIDRAGYLPAGPIEETSVHLSMRYGPDTEVPLEVDDWDHERITLRCRVWKLAE